MKFRNFLASAAFLLMGMSASLAQEKAPANWFNLDKAQDGVMGVSSEKAYETLLKGKQPKKTIVVAVLDSGVEPEHEDLKDVMWVNPKEIAGNGIDDDKNGYVDDIHGWNFLGSKGKDLNYDNLEITRQYVLLKNKKRNKKEEARFETIKEAFESKQAELKQNLNTYEMVKKSMDELEKKTGKSSLSLEEIQAIDAAGNADLTLAKTIMGSILGNMTYDELKAQLVEWHEQLEAQSKYHYSLEFDPRKEMIGDDYNNAKDRNYGNNNYEGPDAEHGTHVAGIIGANRNNNVGMKGVANNVRIMTVRMVPNGDERDKDVANGIRYAVDNGAQVINMSFGKNFPHDKKAVDEAVKYAEKKGVLLVHAAGNSSYNIDETDNFPSKRYGNDVQKGKKTSKTWLEVGALSWKSGKESPAPFSNYGKTTVDLFAPGVDINSTVPDGKYKDNSGTSMAAPVVSGVAALVWSYYPELTAVQLRQILLESVEPLAIEVLKPGTEVSTPFSNLCITGGVVNAYKALELAEKRSKK